MSAFKAGLPQTPAQRILAQYQAAFTDLEAVLLGVTDEQAGLSPAEGEWPLRKILRHMVEAEGTFFAINHYAIERARAKMSAPWACLTKPGMPSGPAILLSR